MVHETSLPFDDGVDFYKDDLYYVNIQILYVNADNELEKIRQTTHLLTAPNQVTSEELLRLIKANMHNAGNRYHLLSILKYNVIMEPEEVLLCPDNDYLSVVKHLDAVPFRQSISLFHDLNDLIFVFHEQSGVKTSHTKKLLPYWMSLNRLKKTLRKQYEANV